MQKTGCTKRQAQENTKRPQSRRASPKAAEPVSGRGSDGRLDKRRATQDVVIARQYPKVLARARTRVASHPTMAVFVDAADIAQSVFRRYLTDLRNGPPIECESLWFLRSTDNRFLEQCRFEKAAKRNRRREDRKVDASGCAAGSFDAVEEAIMAEAEKRVLASLSPREREIFVKLRFDGLAVEAVAAALNLKPDTVRKIDRQVRDRVREMIEG